MPEHPTGLRALPWEKPEEMRNEDGSRRVLTEEKKDEVQAGDGGGGFSVSVLQMLRLVTGRNVISKNLTMGYSCSKFTSTTLWVVVRISKIPSLVWSWQKPDPDIKI